MKNQVLTIDGRAKEANSIVVLQVLQYLHN